MISENHPGGISKVSANQGKDTGDSGTPILARSGEESQNVIPELSDAHASPEVGADLRRRVRQADVSEFINLLVDEILSLRVENQELRKDVTILRAVIFRVNDEMKKVEARGKKGYRKVRKSFRNGLQALYRQMHDQLKRDQFEGARLKDVYQAGLSDLVSYARYLDEGDQSESSLVSNGSVYETDSDESILREKRFKKNPVPEQEKIENKGPTKRRAPDDRNKYGVYPPSENLRLQRSEISYQSQNESVHTGGIGAADESRMIITDQKESVDKVSKQKKKNLVFDDAFDEVSEILPSKPIASNTKKLPPIDSPLNFERMKKKSPEDQSTMSGTDRHPIRVPTPQEIAKFRDVDKDKDEEDTQKLIKWLEEKEAREKAERRQKKGSNKDGTGDPKVKKK